MYIKAKGGTRMKRVMAAMSGGVDSSVVAALLKESGVDVTGATLRLYEKEGIAPEVAAAKSVCDCLFIEHLVFDLRDTFRREVIERFSKEYSCGLTPNPCIECNKYIKFGAMLDKALDLGFDKIATGHYSDISFDSASGRHILYRPADRKKDQTYVLWRLDQHQLSHIVMPLSRLSKQQVREIAQSYGFSSADAKESQDICFVPDGDYAAFLQNFEGKTFEKGNYIDLSGKILGWHLGHQHYTVGQRKGLGIALGKPQFVIMKDHIANTVTLGDEEHIFKKRVYIKDINLIALPSLEKSISCTAKLRYSARDEKCTIHPLSQTEALIEFESPQRGPTPGQSAVFYDMEAVLGGGKIVRSE